MGNCSDASRTRFATVPVSIGGAAYTLTTANFGFALTLAGAGSTTPAGAPSSPDNCIRSPTSSTSWVAVLIAAGGAGDLAVWGSAGWTALNASIPVAIEGGQTVLVVAGPGVDLVGAQLTPTTTSGAGSSSSVTL